MAIDNRPVRVGHCLVDTRKAQLTRIEFHSLNGRLNVSPRRQYLSMSLAFVLRISRSVYCLEAFLAVYGLSVGLAVSIDAVS